MLKKIFGSSEEFEKNFKKSMNELFWNTENNRFYNEYIQLFVQINEEIIASTKRLASRGTEREFSLKNVDFSVSSALEPFYNQNTTIDEILTAIIQRWSEGDIPFSEAYELLKILEAIQKEVNNCFHNK